MKLIIGTICFILIIAIIMVPVSAKVYRVGVSPLILNMGDVEKGSSVLGTFYIVSSSPDEFLVNMESGRGNTDFFKREGYESFLLNYSEEDSSPWVSFLQNPVVLEQGDEIETIGGVIKGSKAINFLLEVPHNAESGWHSVILTPVPTVPSGYGSGANVVSQTSMTLLFNIPGDAVREGIILDITPGKKMGNRKELNIIFENIGDVTIFPVADLIEFFDNEGILVETIKSNAEYVKPGQMTTLKAYVELNELEQNEYIVNAKASYLTGFVTMDSSINLLSTTATTQDKPVITEDVSGFPWWIVILPIIIIVIYIYYKRE